MHQTATATTTANTPSSHQHSHSYGLSESESEARTKAKQAVSVTNLDAMIQTYSWALYKQRGLHIRHYDASYYSSAPLSSWAYAKGNNHYTANTCKVIHNTFFCCDLFESLWETLILVYLYSFFIHKSRRCTANIWIKVIILCENVASDSWKHLTRATRYIQYEAGSLTWCDRAAMTVTPAIFAP